MCLLIQQSKETNFAEEHLLDFYTRNRDGIGVMWAEGGKLHYEKHLPKNAQDCVDFYNRVARGKDACVHYRMKTHGHIDMDNCHPYDVFGFDEPNEMPTLLMHNGILHTDNRKDSSKSDTWHYIRDYLRPLSKHDPAFMFTKEFADVIGRHIGNNRFALMNHLGQVSIINKKQGVTFNGAWMSNEYAWSAHKYLPNKTYYNSKWGEWNSVTKTFEDPTVKKSIPAKAGAVANLAPTGGKKGKRKNKQMTLPTMQDGGKTPTRSLLTNSEKNAVNGVSVDCIWLDDILEIRSILDAVYMDNGTSNKQIECLIEEIGIDNAYRAVEWLTDRTMTEKSWDSLLSNRVEMRGFLRDCDKMAADDASFAAKTELH